MNRLLFVIAGIILAIFFGFHSLGILNREPAHPRASYLNDDYPLETGLTWVYKSAMGLQVVRRVAEPIYTQSPDDPHTADTWHPMQFDLPLLGRRWLSMRRTHEGVVAWRGRSEQLIMRFPMKPGDSWTIDFPEEDLAECTVLQPEEIDVLSKRALSSKLQVVRTNRKTGKKTTDYEWYVRGIGLAKMEVTFGLKATFTLIRFERAEASGGTPPAGK